MNSSVTNSIGLDSKEAPLLAVHKLCAGYASPNKKKTKLTLPELHGISFHLNKGEILGLVGPNGAGKSSLLLALSGVLARQSGTIKVLGANLKDISIQNRAKLIASLPQRLDLLPDFTVAELVLMGRYPHTGLWGAYSASDYLILEQSLGECGITKLAHKSLKQISGGELQLTLLARALVQQGQIMLLDEASSALDLAHKLNVFDILNKRKKAGAGIIVAIHDLNLASLYCDRLIFMAGGEIACQGETAEVFCPEVFEKIYGVKVELYYNSAAKAQISFTPEAWRV